MLLEKQHYFWLKYRLEKNSPCKENRTWMKWKMLDAGLLKSEDPPQMVLLHLLMMYSIQNSTKWKKSIQKVTHFMILFIEFFSNANNIFQMTKFWKWRACEWLPGIKEGREEVGVAINMLLHVLVVCFSADKKYSIV